MLVDPVAVVAAALAGVAAALWVVNPRRTCNVRPAPPDRRRRLPIEGGSRRAILVHRRCAAESRCHCWRE